MQNLSRRDFIAAAGALGGAVLLGGCGDSETASNPAATPKPQPAIGEESGKLSILEWGGYEAGGHKAQKSGLYAGTPYTKEFGADGLAYTYIVNDNQSLQKAAASGPFDLMHPCIQMRPASSTQDSCSRSTRSCSPSFDNLDPFLLERGQVDGKQYMIPWDWGYGSLLYRTDKVDAADATGWELALEREVQGQDLAVERQLRATSSSTALKLGIRDEHRRHDARRAAALQGGADQAEAAQQVLLDERVRPDAARRSSRGDIWITYCLAGGLRDHERGRA